MDSKLDFTIDDTAETMKEKTTRKSRFETNLKHVGLKLPVIMNFLNWKGHHKISLISDVSTSLHSSSTHALNVVTKWILVHREILIEATSML